MDSGVDRLKYQPLVPGQIRLFGIDAGEPNDDISGILIEQKLDSLDLKNNPFFALSYVWGDATHETTTVTVKNITTRQTGTLTITRSLSNVLRNLRNPQNKIGVWVDQICIDQSNDKEKGEQILHMRLIYQRAKWVVAAIENQEQNDLAMDLLAGDEWSTIVPFMKALDAALERVGQECTPENRIKAFQVINSLLRQRYWQRTWIWQEVTAKPMDCLVRYGAKQVLLRNVVSYIISYKQYMVTEVIQEKDWDDQPIWHMIPFIDFWAARRFGRESSLLALLDEVRETDITDPRDKIFAVLPFSTDAAQDLQPTYQQSTHEVYTRFTLWHVVKYQSLDILTFSKGDFGRFIAKDDKGGRITTTVGQSHSKDSGGAVVKFEDHTLASWVPDWRAKLYVLHPDPVSSGRTIRPLPKAENIYDATLPHLFNASGSESPGFQFTFPDAQTFINGLTVHAVKVATIEHVQKHVPCSRLSLEAEQEWYRQFQATKISNWGCKGDSLFKRTIYTDQTFRSEDRIIRHARASAPDEQLIWPNVTQVEDPSLQLGCLKRITVNRTPFHTKVDSEDVTGLYGLGPLWARSGDEIWILRGASVPFVLRRGSWKAQSGSTNANLTTHSVDRVMYHEGDVIFTFVGECFVLGMMDGEVMELMKSDEHDARRSQVPGLERGFHAITIF